MLSSSGCNTRTCSSIIFTCNSSIKCRTKLKLSMFWLPSFDEVSKQSDVEYRRLKWTSQINSRKGLPPVSPKRLTWSKVIENVSGRNGDETFDLKIFAPYGVHASRPRKGSTRMQFIVWPWIWDRFFKCGGPEEGKHLVCMLKDDAGKLGPVPLPLRNLFRWERKEALFGTDKKCNWWSIRHSNRLTIRQRMR